MNTHSANNTHALERSESDDMVKRGSLNETAGNSDVSIHSEVIEMEEVNKRSSNRDEDD